MDTHHNYCKIDTRLVYLFIFVNIYKLFSNSIIIFILYALASSIALAAPSKDSIATAQACDSATSQTPHHAHGLLESRSQTSSCKIIGQEIHRAAHSDRVGGEPGSCRTDGYNTNNVLFTDPWEQGITGGAGLWRGLHDGGILRRVTSPVRHGRYAAEVIVRPGDKYKNIAQERTEVLHPQAIRDGHIITTQEGETQYIAFSVKIPKDWEKPIHYVILWQIHAPGNVKRSPIELHVTDRFFVRTNHYVPYTPDGRRIGHRFDFADGRLNRGDWTDLVIKLTTGTSNNGGITIWRRNEDDASFQEVVDQSGLNLHPGYHKHGMYRGADPVRTYKVWLDGFTIATTFEDAVRAAFGDCAKVD